MDDAFLGRMAELYLNISTMKDNCGSIRGEVMDKYKVKTLIELATSFEKADEIMSKYSGCNDDEGRIAYLMDLFDCEIIGSSECDVHEDYVALLTTIVMHKWRV